MQECDLLTVDRHKGALGKKKIGLLDPSVPET